MPPKEAQTTPGNPDATSVEAQVAASEPVVAADAVQPVQAATDAQAVQPVQAEPVQAVQADAVQPVQADAVQPVQADAVQPVQAVQAAADAVQPVQAVQAVQAAAPAVVAEPVQAVQAVQAEPDAVPVDANYSAILGAFVHELAELYQIKDNAKIKIGSDKVSAANFITTLEVNDNKLTITLTPVDDSAGPAALEAIKLKIAAPKPVEVSPAVEADKSAVEATTAEVQVDAIAVPVKPVEAVEPEEAALNTVAADKSAVAKSEGGYRRRKRNLRTIKKQQQRNRRTMNKH